MSGMLLGRLLVASATLALAACGGGGGSHVSSTPPPTDPPTATTKTCPDGSVIPVSDTCPTPPPPPPAHPTIFSDATAGTDFAALGFELDGPGSGWAKANFTIRYDAAAQQYLFEVPAASTPVKLSLSDLDNHQTSSGPWPTVYSYVSGNNGADVYLSLFNGVSNNPSISLTYTSFGYIEQDSCSSDGYYTTCSLDYGDLFAFGLPTPGSGVPVTGAATYDALVYGQFGDGVHDGHVVQDRQIRGSATMQFDFGAGTLSGHFDPVLVSSFSDHPAAPISLGTYNFVNTVFGVGSTSFSGDLSHSGTDTLGSFDGLFTGPVAQELMTRWTAPYQDPTDQQWYSMFGVWVGKKQ